MKLRLILFALFFPFLVSNCSSSGNKDSGGTGIMNREKVTETLHPLYDSLMVHFRMLEPKVIQPAEGYMQYPYLIPAGFYKQMWDWDGFFIGNHFAAKGKPEYLKYWALNFIKGIDKEGYVSGCATTKGPRPIFGKFAIKPFLSQGVWLASQKLNEYSWIEPYYDALMKVLDYRDQTQYDTVYGLYYWDNAMQSGADNNPALNYFTDDHRSFLSCDASTWQFREFLAQAKIAEKLGKSGDAEMLRKRAGVLKSKINKILWCEEDQVYYNVDRETGAFYKRVGYSSIIPLVAGLAPKEKGRAMIKRYLINPDEMKAAYGFRSLSKQDPDYNNKNIIIPFSNWQGPVWPIANYLYSIALKKYGFDRENAWLAQTLGTLLLHDIRECGSMHENYDADNGTPLAPAADYVDQNGKFVGFIGWNLCVAQIMEGVLFDRWMLLDL